MNKYYYDFHIHSCLSPCADDDNTPNNLAGMGTLNGLNIMALTDHNTCKNCPAFFKAAKKQGIIPIAGMELTTAEDIHIIFLFENLDSAMEFDNLVESKRFLIKNKIEIFGNQLIMDGEDNIIGREENLLINATSITVDECVDLAKQFGGICYPAHIDRDANGIIAILGTVPEDCGFKAIEFYDREKIDFYIENHPIKNCQILIGSDAHHLWDLRDKDAYFLIDDEPYSSDYVRKQLFKMLRENI